MMAYFVPFDGHNAFFIKGNGKTAKGIIRRHWNGGEKTLYFFLVRLGGGGF